MCIRDSGNILYSVVLVNPRVIKVESSQEPQDIYENIINNRSNSSERSLNSFLERKYCDRRYEKRTLIYVHVKFHNQLGVDGLVIEFYRNFTSVFLAI